MAYSILEIRKVAEDGKILSREFFVVDGAGHTVAGPFSTMESAISRMEELKLEDGDEPSTPNPYRP